MAKEKHESEPIKFKEIEIIDFNTELSALGDRRLTLFRKTPYLEIPDVQKRHLGIPFMHRPKGKLHYKVSITNLGKLKIIPGGDLLKCSMCNSSVYSAEGDFEADGRRNEFPIDFCLCPSVIVDYDETLNNETECQIIFNVAITSKEDKEFKKFEETGELKLKIPRVRSEVLFQYLPEVKEKTYTINNPEPCRIGLLKVYHNSKLKCAPPIEHTSYSLHTIIENCANDGKNEDTDYPAGLYLLKAGKHHESCTVRIGSELSVSHLISGQEFEIPVLFDINSVLANPQNADNVFKLQLRTNDNNKTLKDSWFTLKRNRSLTRLDAKLDTNKQIWDILEKESDSESCPMKLNVGAKLNHTIVFRNTADAHPKANIHSCVKVWGVKICVKTEEETAYQRLKLQDGKTIDDVVSLRDAQLLRPIPQAQWVDLDPQGQWEMNIHFNTEFIKWIDPNPKETKTWIPLKITLSFNYIEDSNGKTYRHDPATIMSKPNERTFTYEVRLSTVSTSPWMCVDFGTSAIVAASANYAMGDLNLDLINLRERKNKLLATAFPDKRSCKDEEGVLINSILCLNPAPDMQHAFDMVTGTDTDFKKYALLLSPGDDVLNADYMTPNLKLLMGYDKIPNIFSVIQQTFQYATQEGFDDQGRPIFQPHFLIENGESSKLMHLEKITKIVYLQLFKHYLRSASDNVHRRIERLVMTVPNTYTPLQLDFIRRIVREALPELRPEEFHLVSESDAVSCYFLYKSEVLLQQMMDANRSIYNNPERRALIYDMGAGTLDLTLMHTTKKHDSLNVRMLGKLGVSKAGNYLDYVLGQILVEAVQKEATSTQILGSDETIRRLGAEHLASLVTIDADCGFGSSKERLALKTYIKEMKKLLNSDGGTLLNDLAEDNELAKWAANAGITYNFRALTVEDIRNHNFYKEYIRSVTTDLLNDFETYVCQTNPEFKLQEIDVVVFSGRSTQLLDIRRNVKEALKDNPHVYYVDLINEKSSTDIDIIMGTEGQSTKLKTVVAEGAYYSVNFMDCNKSIALDHRKIFASFGLVQYDRIKAGHRIWTPLVLAQKPCKDEGVHVDDCQSYVKVTREIDVNGNRYIDLIQSYCGDVAGCKNYSSNETINVLTSIELPRNIEKAKVEFTLYIEPVNGMTKSIHLKINDQEYDVNPHVDIQRNNALRRSLWPVVFS